jgi:hypothetical protein
LNQALAISMIAPPSHHACVASHRALRVAWKQAARQPHAPLPVPRITGELE